MIATTPQRSWHRIEALPRPVHIALWLLLVIIFASPSFLLLFVPVAAAVWLLERGRSHTFDSASTARIALTAMSP